MNNSVPTGLVDVKAQMVAFYENARESGKGSWRVVGKIIGISGSYARMIALGESPLTPTIAARWLGTVDIEESKRVTVCPSCLAAGKREVHAVGDCKGAPIAAVVVLAPGEVVAPAPAPKPLKRVRKLGAVIHVPLELHAEMVAERRPGESLADVIRRNWRPT